MNIGARWFYLTILNGWWIICLSLFSMILHNDFKFLDVKKCPVASILRLGDWTLYFQGIHLTVNARTEDDIDIDDITKKVAKSSGSNYSFHQEKPKPVETPSPVVCITINHTKY